MTDIRHRTTGGRRRGQALLFIGGTIALGAAALVTSAFLRSGGDGSSTGAVDVYAVKRGSFDIILPASGELVALKQVEIRNQLTTRAVITEIIEEGKIVNTGDVLIRFNDEDLRVSLNQITDEVNLAENAVVSATAELDIRQKEGESELAKANLAVYLADLALNAWKEGEYNSTTARLKMAVESAQKNFDRLKDRYEASAKLMEREFISLDEYRNDEIAMIEARSRWEQATTDLDIYNRYQSKQDSAKKESDLEQAQGELERAKQRTEARIRSAESELGSKKHQLQSKRDRKRQLEQQISYCNIVAPSPGLVVYGSSMESGRWGWNQDPPHVGLEMYPNQSVIVLPDTSHMAAEVKVTESLSGNIKVGQRATVTSDALPNAVLSGEVTSIGVLAASGGFRDPNRRDYTVRIALGANEVGLKPCMRCKAEIKVDRVEQALYVPIQAIFHAAELSYVWVPSGIGYAQRKVTVGRSSETYTELLEGLEEGERVLLREPRPEEVVSRLPTKKIEKPDPADAQTALPAAVTPATVVKGEKAAQSPENSESAGSTEPSSPTIDISSGTPQSP